MDNIFFSTENYRKIYNIIENNLKKSHNISISSTPTYKKRIIDTMKYVYNNKGEFNLPEEMSQLDKSLYLSQKTIKIFMLYENDTRVKKTEDHNEFKKMEKRNSFDGRITDMMPVNNNFKLSRDIDSSTMPLNEIHLSRRPESILKQDNRDQIELNLQRSINERTETKKKPVDINFRDNRVSEFEHINIENKYMELAASREKEYENVPDAQINKEKNREIKEDQNGDNRNTYLEQPEFKIETTPLQRNTDNEKTEHVLKPLNTDELLENLQELESDNTLPDEFIETSEPNKIITTNGIFETEEQEMNNVEEFVGLTETSELEMTPIESNANVSIDDILNELNENEEETENITKENKEMEQIDSSEELEKNSSRLDRIENLLESFLSSQNRIETIETNLNQMFFALKDDNHYKTETHTLHIRVDDIIDYLAYTNCEQNNSDCEKVDSAKPCSEEKSCVSRFWMGEKVRVKFPMIKNLISIRLKKVVTTQNNMATTGSGCNSCSNTSSGSNDKCKYPFYYLYIDEIKSDIIQGNSVFGDDSFTNNETPFSKMYFDDWTDNNQCSDHRYFSNHDGDKTEFKTPKASLDSMTLSIRNPDKNCTKPNLKFGTTYLFFEVKTLANYAGWETIEPTI